MGKLLENKMFKICIGAIILIILIIIIAMIFVGGKANTITDATLSNAAKAYYEKNPGLYPRENYDSVNVSLATLIAAGYISSDAEGASCPSYVTVTNINNSYSYTPFIMCNTSTAPTTSLVGKITSSLVTTGSGLYNDNGKYIFKGENPNNYVQFGESKWRIIGLDENNNIKMIYSDLYVQYQAWDDRYNKDVSKQNGINDYVSNEKSRIKEYLDGFFSNENNIEKFTGARIARTTKHTVCVGKVDLENGILDPCTETLTERISTITVNDYINASLDESCDISNTINCQNYNFLNMPGWTITADSKDSYSVYYIDKDEGIQVAPAYIGKAIRPVITLKNDVKYMSGTGTQLDPYMIG